MMGELVLVLTVGTALVIILFIISVICFLYDKDRLAKTLIVSMGVIIVVLLIIFLIAVYYESFK